jgi:hypothetical protein
MEFYLLFIKWGIHTVRLTEMFTLALSSSNGKANLWSTKSPDCYAIKQHRHNDMAVSPDVPELNVDDHSMKVRARRLVVLVGVLSPGATACLMSTLETQPQSNFLLYQGNEHLQWSHQTKWEYCGE